LNAIGTLQSSQSGAGYRTTRGRQGTTFGSGTNSMVQSPDRKTHQTDRSSVTPGHDRTGAWTPFARRRAVYLPRRFWSSRAVNATAHPDHSCISSEDVNGTELYGQDGKKAVTPTWGRGMGKAAVGVICADNRERPYLACSVLELASRHPSKRSNRSRVIDN